MDKSPRGQDLEEAGQHHPLGTELDSRFQTWSQLLTLPGATAALSVDTVCQASRQSAHGKV